MTTPSDERTPEDDGRSPDAGSYRPHGTPGEAAGVEPGRICLEISERVLSSDLPHARRQARALRERGFRLALDDFGAGNTALTWLQQLPIDVLKLDRAFTAGLEDPATHAIVASLLTLSAELGVESLAEGVETDAQRDTLTDLGCRYLQGYLLSRPRSASEITAMLA